mmetsp:Transcript_44538/g.105544  ORF Transcript_44538/g.105544 Transcript_44538/m.105544 type:complete len:772 (+) Transcript_44538:142-2457(+)
MDKVHPEPEAVKAANEVALRDAGRICGPGDAEKIAEKHTDMVEEIIINGSHMLGGNMSRVQSASHAGSENVRSGSKRSAARVAGVSEEVFEQIVVERQFRKGSKERPKLVNRGLTIMQELAYVESQQKQRQVEIGLDEEEMGIASSSAEDDMAGPMVKHVNWRRDGPGALLAGLVCLAVLITVWSWSPREPRHDVHHVKMHKYQAHVTSPLYAISGSSPLTLSMHPDRPTNALDLKMVLPCAGLCPEGHTRLATLLTGTTTVTWQLLAAGRTVATGKKVLSYTEEEELFEELVPEDLGVRDGEELTVRISTDGEAALGLLCQVVQLGWLGQYRVPLSATLFVLVFALIISERLNRCYATFIGAMSALFMLCITYETPTVATVMAMIDFGTLILLCTMMMIVHILAVTGFFQWVAVRLAAAAGGNAKVLFFLLAISMGAMSCILPNVTCVMLIGPVTISLCNQMGLDPVPFYLSQTICSTIGGTATLIGDPPNLVIGHKLKLKFVDFIIYNGPVICVILPLAACILFWRFKSQVSGKVEIDLDKMRKAHPIIDQRQFLYAVTIFFFITLGLFTSPVHDIRPAWFCLVGFFFMAMVISHHHIKSFLNAVEWDTLLFFANLFIFVECLAELGLIKKVGELLADTIKQVDQGSRLEVAVILVLWVSTIGSAFLESLPYTTTLTYILADLRNTGDLGIPVEPLSWALSLGACVGGIGSIMGSSANLVAIAVSERYSPDNPIKGFHFLKYGFPTLLIITCVSTVYQVFLFSVIEPYK